MQLSHLSLTNFRNFARLDIDVPGGPVLLVGGNAQGKTSLLEAIYYLATFTSFHATQDRQLISFFHENEPLTVARINAEFQYSDDCKESSLRQSTNHRIEVRLICERDELGASRMRKEILVNGVGRKAGEAIGAFNAVLFLPHMLRIVEGSPEDRRRYLNLSFGQVVPHYAASLSEYNRVLSQRNALLKQLNERGGDLKQLDYWDAQLAGLGSRIIHTRIHALHELEKIALQIHRDLTHDQEVLRFDYQPSFDSLTDNSPQYQLPLRTSSDRTGQSIERIQSKFMDRLQHIRQQEIQRGVTTIGPHRDELRFFSNGIDLGIYGSRGQGRTAVLSFKFAEMAWMKQKTGQSPVLLLDEVLAELDPVRRNDLLTRLTECEQALLTTTDLDQFSEEYVKTTRIWKIMAGQVQG